MDQACPKCNKIYAEADRCPVCNVNLTKDWSGKIAIITPEASRIAKEMDIQLKGEYALKT